MGKIIAIGGGEIGRPGQKIETLKIDREILKLSGLKNPKFLFIPTASSDAQGYVDTVNKYFGKKLGCKVSTLLLVKNPPTDNEVRELILNSDIIYVGGGDTLKMLKIWRKFGVDKIISEAYKKGIVLSGISAGSICWFKFGNSDSRRSKNPKAPMIKVKGLNFINALHCPHYDSERDRRSSLKAMMKNTSGVAVAIDNCSALEIVDNKYRVISSKKTANTYKVYWNKGKFYEKIVEQRDTFEPIEVLVEKD